MKKRVLCLLAEGFEEIEALAPVDLLRRAGAEVIVASISGELEVTGRSAVKVIADDLLHAVAEEEFDLLLLPGGPGVKRLREDERPAALAAQYVQAGKIVGAICAAPLVLLDGGVLAGRRYTAHFSTADELPAALVDERVVEDGVIVTSRGAATAIDFGLQLVARLYGDSKAREVAESIMYY